MPRTQTVFLRRQRTREGVTMHFVFYSGTSNRNRSYFIKPEQMPPFDGEEGWFEIEKVSAKPWPFYRVLRQVETPGLTPS